MQRLTGHEATTNFSMYLPEELLAQIFTNLQDDAENSIGGFRDLRVAFTCKGLYAMFQPFIQESQCQTLFEAAKGRLLKFEDPASRQRQELFSQTEQKIRSLFRGAQLSIDHRNEIAASTDGHPAAGPAFGSPLEVALTIKSYDAVEADIGPIWSLHSLLAKQEVSIHRLRVIFKTDCQWPSWSQYHQKEWGRAVLRLLELVSGIGEIELELSAIAVLRTPFHDENNSKLALSMSPAEEKACLKRSHAYLASLSKARKDIAWPTFAPKGTTIATIGAFDDVNKTWHFHSEINPQTLAYQLPENAMGTSHLSTLDLRGDMFHPTLFPFVDPLVAQSSSSLTNLQLRECGLGPDDWNEVLPNWNFSKLATFHIECKRFPIFAIVAFLRNNISLKKVRMVIQTVVGDLEGPLEFKSVVSLPNLQSVYGTPEIILPILKSPLTFPNLESVTISQGGKEPHAPLGDLTDVTALFSLLSQRAPRVREISLDLTFTPELSTWMHSANTNIQSAEPNSQRLSGALSKLVSVKSLSLNAHTIPREVTNCMWPPFIYVPAESVAAFVGAFPSLEEVAIDALFYCPPDADEFWAGVMQFWTASASLQRLEMKGISGATKTALWNRGEEEPTPGYAAFAKRFFDRFWTRRKA
ncbi:hypothetical protein DFP72DRAFT_942931 [Ephemerocybe angulata]|uniref:Uncharacterized protein n=1 Tax=Ephemerocybe angulata TaxID=980116 RepID=A0A8H6H940_9AGAR|nr:hypothetical protein DFP72DRAFT_942931 [Tulosesus angulatus]